MPFVAEPVTDIIDGVKGVAADIFFRIFFVLQDSQKRMRVYHRKPVICLQDEELAQIFGPLDLLNTSTTCILWSIISAIKPQLLVLNDLLCYFLLYEEQDLLILSQKSYYGQTWMSLYVHNIFSRFVDIDGV